MGDNPYACLLMDNVELGGERMTHRKKWANAGRMSLSRPKETSYSGQEEEQVVDGA